MQLLGFAFTNDVSNSFYKIPLIASFAFHRDLLC